MPHSTQVKVFALAYFYFSSTITQGRSDENIIINQTPPPGFEFINEPQSSLVDIFYGQNRIGSSLATFTDQWLEFDDPDEVLSLLPDILPKQQTSLKAQLAQRFQDQSFCVQQNAQCSSSTLTNTAVQLDDENFRIKLLVDSQYRIKNRIELDKYLPRSSAPLSSLHNIDGSFVGSSKDSLIYSLRGNSQLSLGEKNITALWNVNSHQRIKFNSVFMQYHYQNLELKLGSFSSRGQDLSMLNVPRLIGIRAATLDKTRTDLNLSSSNPIFIFLTEPARISIFKDKQLITVQRYPAGNQQLDTQRLPGGSYTIEVSIEDSSGNIRNEEFFINKNTRFRSNQEPDYFVELGALEKANEGTLLPVPSDQFILRMGGMIRIANNLGVSTSVTRGPSRSAFELGLVKFGVNSQLRVGSVISDQSSRGLTFSADTELGKLKLRVDATKLINPKEKNEDILAKSFTTANINISYPLNQGRISMFAQYNKRNNQSEKVYGVSFRKRIYQTNDANISIALSASYGRDRQFRVLSNILLMWRDANQSLNYNVQHEFDDDTVDIKRAFSQRLNYAYNLNDQGIPGLETFMFAQKRQDRVNVGSRFEYDSTNNKTDVNVEYIDDGSNQTVRYNGETHLTMGTVENRFDLSSKENAQSAVLVVVKGINANGPFEALVNGKVVGLVKPNGEILIPLQAFKRYRIRLKPIGEQLIDFDEAVKLVTLYPGNVAQVEFDVNPITVVVGQALLENLSPIVGGVIVNTREPSQTDDEGWFQVRIKSLNQPIRINLKDGSQCAFIIENTQDIEDNLLVVDQVVCQKI